MPVIMSKEESLKNLENAARIIKSGDVLNSEKFNSLPSPVTAKMCGGDEWWIETLCVQTGAMRLDVCGQIDFSHFSEVLELIDYNGDKHDPDDFWLEE